jgi:valyl-tRNA synthetase
VWDDFCAWYLEIVKPEFLPDRQAGGQPIDSVTYEKTVQFFESLLKILHPFMPFITEELWHELNERKEKECIIVEAWPKPGAIHEPKEALKLIGNTASKKQIDSFGAVIKKLANLSELSFVDDKVANASNFLVGTLEFYIPMEGKIDAAKERESILKEIEYQKGFIVVLDKKLLNEKFIASAKPEVVALERKKKADAEAKIKSLEESLRNL